MVSSSCSLQLKGIASPLGDGLIPLPLIRGNKPSRSYSTLRFPNHRRRRPEAVLVATHTPPSKTMPSQPQPQPQSLFLEPFRQVVKSGEGKKKRRSPISNETLDGWMRELSGEIVRNIGEAPLLMQIFSGDRKGVRLEKEEAVPENWPSVKKRWDQESRTPDGIILIEEIADEVENEDIRPSSSCGLGQESKTWGVVVQGRGMECVACYILNTCRVESSAGFCTHFCLVRAKCFMESAQIQMKNAWLQEGR